MAFLTGQVIVTEGNPKSFISRAISYFTKSKYTHAFIVTGNNEAVEATFPRVRKFTLNDRMAELAMQNRGYAVFDWPDIQLADRWKLAKEARSWIGKFYDIGQILIYLFTGRFFKDGIGTVVCSRLITGLGQKVLNFDCFTEETIAHLPEDYHRKNNLREQMAAPCDFFVSRLVLLEVVTRQDS